MVDGKVTNIAVIGLGGFGQFLVNQWSRLKEINVKATSDLNPASAIEGYKFYRDYKDVLKDPEVDIVCLATPPSTHKTMAIEAIEAGKHVLVEKPLAMTAEDAQDIADAAEDAGKIVTVNQMLRYNPLVEALRELVAAHVFGRVMRVDLMNYAMQDTVPEGHWFWNRDVSGGILIEHGVHFFDMASWIINSDAEEVNGLALERKPGMEDRMFAGVIYENHVIGTFWHSFTRPAALETTTFRMAWDLGDIQMNGWIPTSVDLHGWTDEAGEQAIREHFPGIDLNVEKFDVQEAASGDFKYKVDRSVSAHYDIGKPKLEVYGDCLRAIMLDMIEAIKDPDHEMRVIAEDGVIAVGVAEDATEAAHHFWE